MQTNDCKYQVLLEYGRGWEVTERITVRGQKEETHRELSLGRKMRHEAKLERMWRKSMATLNELVESVYGPRHASSITASTAGPSVPESSSTAIAPRAASGSASHDQPPGPSLAKVSATKPLLSLAVSASPIPREDSTSNSTTGPAERSTANPSQSDVATTFSVPPVVSHCSAPATSAPAPATSLQALHPSAPQVLRSGVGDYDGNRKVRDLDPRCLAEKRIRYIDLSFVLRRLALDRGFCLQESVKRTGGVPTAAVLQCSHRSPSGRRYENYDNRILLSESRDRQSVALGCSS
jgi:hypothetical protein